MKSTIIPAQITTVEDKIAANFSFTQILLFLSPLFIVVFVYAVLPDPLHFSYYKIPLIVVPSLLCFILALRVKERLVLHWMGILSAYLLRPRYYVYDKNDVYLRDQPAIDDPQQGYLIQPNVSKVEFSSSSPNNVIKLQNILETDKSSLRFRFKKGGIHVVASEV